MKWRTIGWLYLLALLAIASAIYRLALIAEAFVTGKLPIDPGDLIYVQRWVTATMHLVTGLAFMILGPLQFSARLRQRWPRWHRVSGRVFVVAALCAAGTAMGMNVIFPPVGGLGKSSAVFVFGIAQIVTVLVALRYILRRDVAAHRAWMMRAFAIGLGVSTQRLFFIPVFVVSGVPSGFVIGLGMWIGFGVNVLVVEVLLWRERRRVSLEREAVSARRMAAAEVGGR